MKADPKVIFFDDKKSAAWCPRKDVHLLGVNEEMDRLMQRCVASDWARSRRLTSHLSAQSQSVLCRRARKRRDPGAPVKCWRTWCVPRSLRRLAASNDCSVQKKAYVLATKGDTAPTEEGVEGVEGEGEAVEAELVAEAELEVVGDAREEEVPPTSGSMKKRRKTRSGF